MIVSKTLAILATVLTAIATRVHNQIGGDAWIQDNQGHDHAFQRGKTVTIDGGWAFIWRDKSIYCPKSSAAFGWSPDYGDVYLKNDGYLYDSSSFLMERGSALGRDKEKQ